MLPQFDADFGLKPEGLRPASGKVRLEMSKLNVAFQYAMTSLISLGGLFLGGYLLFGQPLASLLFNILAGLAFPFLAGVLVFFLGIRGSHFWVELDGAVIRFKNLYTFQVREQRVEDIKGIWTLAILKGGTVTRITEKLIGRVRGFEIRFSNTWYVVRVLLEMPQGLNFVAAVVGQMNQKGKVVPAVVDLDGKPLIQYLHWNEGA